MSRQTAQRGNRHIFRSRLAQKVKFHLPSFEWLEDRTMLDTGGLPAAIVVGRTLATPSTAASMAPSPSYFVGEVENNQVTITYTVYNEQADPETGVLLTTTLEPGVTFLSSSVTLDGTTTTQFPDQSGQNLAWSLGPIQGYDRESVAVTVSLPALGAGLTTPTQLDTGASAYATLDAGAVSNTTPAATLQPASPPVDASGNSLLAPPLDPTDPLAAGADANDPFIQEEAAKLSYDPTQIFNFLHTQIGYNSYTGSLRGARGTLWSSAGNALDVANLGVALMCASGIPAQYVSGTLSQSQAQQLILSMFPASYQTVGYIPVGTQVSDPANDPQLLSETESHYWFQFDAGSGMQDADPLMAGATIGQTLTTSTGTFTAIPQSLRETTTIQLVAEFYSQASALFGLSSGLQDTTVAFKTANGVPITTFNDAELVGRPLTIGNFVSQSGVSAIFTEVTNTYTPYIVVGDEALHDSQLPDAITGTPYQEVLTNFPLASQILTGLFLNVTPSGPGTSSETFSRALVDRIGYAARQGMASPEKLSVNPSDPPIITPFDLTTLNVLPGLQSPAGAQLEQERANQANARISTETNPSQVEQAEVLADIARTELANFAVGSDQETADIATGSRLVAYFDAPRITAFSSELVMNSSGSTLLLSFDLVEDSIQTVLSPGQNAQAQIAFGITRGAFDSSLESTLFPTSGAQNVSSAMLIQQALQEKIPFIAISGDNVSLLQSLGLPDEAIARVTNDVQSGLLVLVPTKSLNVDGTQEIAWLTINPSTGEMLTQSEDGENQGLTEEQIVKAVVAFQVGTILTVIGTAGSLHGPPQLKQAYHFAKGLGSALISGSLLALVLPEVGLASLFGGGLIGVSIEELLQSVGDPPLQPVTVDLNIPYSNNPSSTSGSQTHVPSIIPAGQVRATVQGSRITASGNLSASWGSAATNSFLASSLITADASVVSSQGATVGVGTLSLSSQSPISVSISGSTQYGVSGSGSFSFYGPAESSLGVGGNWTNYSATGTGDVSITLTVPAGALTVNGTALPAGTYTITTNSATLSGSGNTSSPNYSGSVSIASTNGTINLGPGSGNLSVGGNPLDPGDETTLDRYTGTINVSANGDGTDSVSLSGNAGNVLQVTTTPSTITTDQNTPITFATNIQTSLADTYNLTANAPTGWTVAIDSSGNVTVTPAPGLQSGTYPIQIIAESQTDANLVAQTSVDVTITPTQPGISFTVNPDTQFTVPFNGAQLPTAFRATIQNLGPAADTYNLTFSNVPSGFTLVNSGTSVTVPAGETGILGIYLEPNTGQPIPPPGTQLSFTVTATSTTDSSITLTQNLTFTVPEIDAVSLTSTPTSLSSSPGVAATTTLTLQNDGNVSETVTLSAATPSGVTATGLSTITLAVGATQTETLTLTPAASVALNQTLATTITASFGPSSAPVTTTDEIDMLVQSAQAAAVSTASIAANAADNSSLASVLSDLSTTLASLQSATSPALFAEAQTDLGNLSTLLSADPALAPFLTELQPMITAANADNLAGMLSGSTSLFDSITGVLNVEATEQFTIAVTPIEADLDLGQGETFSVQLTDTGNDPETLNLSAGTLPSGVSVAFGSNSVSLSPNQSISVPVTLTQTSQSTTYFELNVTAAASVEQHTDSAMVAVRPSVADVLSVTATPSAISAGTPVSVSAQAFNTANVTRSVQAQVEILDSSGDVVGATTEVPVSLVPGTGDLTLNLGQVSTTGLANGLYSINVSFVTGNGTPLPGQSSQTDFEIGQPVTASVAASTVFVPPGTSTVTTTIKASAAPQAFTGQSVGDIEAVYLAPNNFTFNAKPLGLLDAPAFVIQNTGGTPITDGVLAVGPVGVSKPDSFDVGTVAAGGSVIIVPGLSNDGQSHPSGGFFAHTGSALDTSDAGIDTNNVQFEFTGEQNGATTDSGIFTPAATFGPSENDSTPINFLGGLNNDDIICNGNCFGPAIVANLYAAGSTSGNSSPNTPPISVELGYADNVRPSPLYPDPWEGSPNTVFVGTVSDTPRTTDTGAILITNNTGSPETINDVSVTFSNGVTRDLWGSNVIPAYGNLILAQTSPGGTNNFNTSDIDKTLPYPKTYADGELDHAAQIKITLNGVLLPTFYDTGHVLTTGGSDPGGSGVNESLNWRPIGTTGEDNPGGTTVSAVVTHNLPASGYDVEPTSISPTATSTSSSQVVWNAQLVATANASQFELTGTVDNMAPGEVREISLGTTIAATTSTPTGQQIVTTLTLPPVTVAAEHIISIDPSSQTVDRAGTATYMVTLLNPLPTDETYALSTTGLDGLTVGLASSIDVPAGRTVTTPLTITVPAEELADRVLFTVNVQTLEGGQDSVEGQLIIAPQVTLQPLGVYLGITPTQATAGQGGSAQYVLTVSNVGSVDDTYSLSTAGLPTGVTASFGETTIDVPPGVSNFRDVPLTVTVPQGITPGSYPFTVTATSTTDSTVSSTTNGTLTVTTGGVTVTLNPGLGAPGSSFQATVTNTGTITDTYTVALAGPAALVSTLGTSQVTLAPGASQMVPISTGAVDFAVQGSLPLTAAATSTTNPAIQGSASANLSIPASQGLTAEFTPDSQTLPQPGMATFLLMVHNTGNSEDSYSATIMGTNGPVAANLVGLDGSPTQSISTFILPGLSTGEIELQADLSAVGQGTVTVDVQSLTSSSINASPAAVVAAMPVPTRTQLTAAPSPSMVGQSVTFTATVTPNSGASTPTGTVAFTIDGVSQAPIALAIVDGHFEATLSTSTLAPGQHEIAASYSGDADFSGSDSNVVMLVVNRPPPSDGPRVTEVQRFGYHMMPTSIVLTFDQALEQATADDAHNYRITGPCGRAIRVTSAAYDPTSGSVTLRPSKRINIHHKYELNVDGAKAGGLTDTQGLLLDGADSGKPGSDYRAPLTWRNLVLDRPAGKTLRRTKTTTQSGKPKSEPAAHVIIHKAVPFTRARAFRR